MSIFSRLVPSSVKGKLILTAFGLVSLVVLYQVARGWWLHGYSQGLRHGIIRKISHKGSPLCRYWLGEMEITRTQVNSSQTQTAVPLPPELWEFSIQAKAGDPLVGQIEEAVRSNSLVSVQYRQDKGRWWDCTPTEYFVTGISK